MKEEPTNHTFILRVLIFVLFTFHFISFNTLSQQSKIDSLLSLLKTQKADTNKVNTLVALSYEYRGSEAKKALDLARQALTLAGNLSSQRMIARACITLGVRQYEQRNYKEAPSNLERGLKYAEEINNGNLIAQALRGLGIVQQCLWKMDRALLYQEQAIDISKRSGDKLGIAISHKNIAVIYLSLGNYDQELEYLHRSLKTYEELDRKADIAQSLASIAFNYFNRGKYDQALEYHQRSLKINEEIGDKAGIAYSLSFISLLYHTQGLYKQALDYYTYRYTRIHEEQDGQSDNATELNVIGQIYDYKERYERALEYYQRSLTISEERGDKNEIFASLQHIGSILSKEGHFEEAIGYDRRCLKILEELGDTRGIANSLLNIALKYDQQGNNDLALEYHRKSLKILEALGDKRGIVDAHNNIAQNFVHQGKYGLAMEHHTISLKVLEELGDRLGIASTLNNIALVHIKQNQNDAAINTATRAYVLAKVIGAIDPCRETSQILSIAYAQKGAFTNAYKYQKEYADLKESLINYNIDEMKVRNETEKLDKQNALLEKEKKLQASILQRQTLLRNVFIAGLGVVIIIAMLIYTRYRQRKKLSEQLTNTLDNLEQTQAQLIQSEKMASLGQLTAGIAHEIKNPLNFVNNFSEISSELVDEFILAKTETDRQTIAHDLKTNLSRINEHGKRADSIVKSMMMHARSGGGEKQLTNINHLLDEAMNLTYHGFRAQISDFNITIEKKYDETLTKINIVPQDIYRVFLNILNNACYAVHEHVSRIANPTYSPTVSISTGSLKDKIEIRIRDNGNGIPENIREKIFEPFFTTKPSGEGTGLGLSISYDIIKAHSGEITVDTNDGDFTEFIITLSTVTGT